MTGVPLSYPPSVELRVTTGLIRAVEYNKEQCHGSLIQMYGGALIFITCKSHVT